MKTVPIEGSGGYTIREDGLVRNRRSKTVVQFLLQGSMRRGSRGRKKYPAVMIYRGNKRVMVRLHRLLAQAFIPNPENYPLVLHKDDNALNFSLNNLMWGTDSMNQQMRWKASAT